MKPDRIQFYTTNKCQLTCNFCAKSVGINPEVFMTQEIFEKYAQRCLNFGIKSFELTPIVGDPLLDPLFLDRVKFLHNKSDKIIAFTNLIALTKKICNDLDQFTRFRFNISVYGDNKQQYEERTGSTLFFEFLSNYVMLSKHLLSRKGKGFKIEEINLRYAPKEYKNSECINLIRLYTSLLEQAKLTEKVHVFSTDYNWNTKLVNVKEDLSSPLKKRSVKGICKNWIHDIGIWPDGDVIGCGNWFDINKKMKLGNLEENSLEEIFSKESLFNKICNEQRNGEYRSLCKYCDFIEKNEDPFYEE